MILEKYLVHHKIYCDLDGVLCDFIKQANKIHKYWMDVYRKNKQLAWQMLVEFGANKFWSTMDWESDGKELWNYIKKYNPIILSAIPQIGKNEAMDGKREWIAKNLGWEYVSSSIITFRSQKQKYSGVGKILIDDRDKSIKEWEYVGGIGILHKTTKNTISELKKIIL
jgi:hypothetical protein